ncbi:Uncharacterised protein [Klebsiella pneumoniae]|uniref:Uncharacterized protein n=1 Tax=Klebsiella pneumoniae TaxID=573 RepID=A0A377TUA2_KLEPN|nr:Uncharacterised protein [Klebsiella pneumoniae]
MHFTGFGRPGDFGRLFGGAFREQAIEIAAVAFLFANLLAIAFTSMRIAGEVLNSR